MAVVVVFEVVKEWRVMLSCDARLCFTELDATAEPQIQITCEVTGLTTHLRLLSRRSRSRVGHGTYKIRTPFTASETGTRPAQGIYLNNVEKDAIVAIFTIDYIR